MELTLSIYLELIRFGGALMVFFGHIMGLSPSIYKVLGPWHIEHDGVVFFFVLSGYVISYVAMSKENDLYTYAINRIARIYSVALPALLLAVLIELHTWFTTVPAVSLGHELHYVIKTVLFSVTFLNEVWWKNIQAFWDAPYWSLGYEVWYYVLFGVCFFFNGWKRFILASTVVAIIGLKIMLLLPVWLVGVGIQHLHRHYTLKSAQAWIIWLSTFVIYFALKPYHPYTRLDSLIGIPAARFFHQGLYSSSGFAWDYFLALLVSANIFSVRFISLPWLTKPIVVKVIQYCASYTFSLYLYQALFIVLWTPYLWAPLVAHHFPNAFNILCLIVAVFSSVLILGRFTEHKKNTVRGWLKVLFAKLQRVKISKPIIDYQGV